MNTATQLIKETFQKEFKGVEDKEYDYAEIYRQRLIGFRKEKNAIVRVEHPTNLPRARQLGYKAKQGIIVARIRIRKGTGLFRRPRWGRRPKRMGVNKLTRRMSIQGIAEQRVQKKYPNMEVLNSYYIGEDGKNHYFEVILVDPWAPTVRSDKELNWVFERQHTKRALRGLTSAQKKSRGLKDKSKRKRSKNRPSLRAHNRHAK